MQLDCGSPSELYKQSVHFSIKCVLLNGDPDYIHINKGLCYISLHLLPNTATGALKQMFPWRLTTCAHKRTQPSGVSVVQ